MVTSSVILYEDSQYQADAAIGPQPPIPGGVHDIELSWDRKAGYMRVVIEGRTWHFKEFLGKAVVVGTDNQRGRINLRGMARLDKETLILYRPPGAAPHKMVTGTHREATHNRLCYRRSSHDWRLRDERRPDSPNALVFAKSYLGDLSAEWDKRDNIAHIYHNGWTVIDSNNVAHLYDPDITLPLIRRVPWQQQ
jgi:hypothetical protein